MKSKYLVPGVIFLAFGILLGLAGNPTTEIFGAFILIYGKLDE